MHGLPEIRQLCEIKATEDGFLEFRPGTMEELVQIPTGMTPDHGDAQTGDELSQRTAPAFFDRCLQAFEGLLAEPLRLDDLLTISFQFIQIAKIVNPAMANELFQCCCRKSLDIHAGLLAEMRELLHQLGSAVGINTV